MLDIDPIFFLFFGDPSSTVLEHVVHVAGSSGATVCVLHREGDTAPICGRLQRICRQILTNHPIGLEERSVAGDLEEIVRVVRQRSGESGRDALVLLSPERIREGAPPLFEPFLREVAGRLHVPVYVLDGTTSPEDVTRIHASGVALGDDHFRVRGCKPIKMTYFGIDPRRKLFGLIQVQNRVEVQFDLIAQREGAERSLPSSYTKRPRPTCAD